LLAGPPAGRKRSRGTSTWAPGATDGPRREEAQDLKTRRPPALAYQCSVAWGSAGALRACASCTPGGGRTGTRQGCDRMAATSLVWRRAGMCSPWRCGPKAHATSCGGTAVRHHMQGSVHKSTACGMRTQMTGRSKARALGMVCVRCSRHGRVVAAAATQAEQRVVCVLALKPSDSRACRARMASVDGARRLRAMMGRKGTILVLSLGRERTSAAGFQRCP